MHIVVCVKQVLAPESALAPSPDATRVTPAGTAEYRMNRYDACALEAALRLRDAAAGVTVEAVTVGPAPAREVLHRALGMGADRATHVLARESPWDPCATAEALAAALAGAPVALILAGAMSEDLMQGIVGPALAARLDRPCATSAVSLTMAPDGRQVEAAEELEDGERRVVALELPALVTVQTGIHPPRYPSLSGLLRARRQPVREVVAPVQPAAAMRVAELMPPARTRPMRMLDGSSADKATELKTILQRRGFFSGGRT